MNTSARQLPVETDRITRAIFEHASLISREQQLGDAELLGLLAHFAATAVESKRLRQDAVKAWMMDHELALAMDVQQHLLPQEQECVQGLECVGPVKSLPAALCAHVDAWAAGAEQFDDMTVVGLRVRG
jgi:serine phosphatase RsbU (regulator of sigma subunit)